MFAVYEDKEGNVWTGILGSGLNVFSRTEETFVNEKFPPSQQSFSSFQQCIQYGRR